MDWKDNPYRIAALETGVLGRFGMGTVGDDGPLALTAVSSDTKAMLCVQVPNQATSDEIFAGIQRLATKARYANQDKSKSGPCPPDCPICREGGEPEHDMTSATHTGEAPDGIMDLCPKCVADMGGIHYRGDWHRWEIAEREKCK